MRTNSRLILILEIGTHNHVVPPWLSIFSDSQKECWTEITNRDSLRGVLNEYGFLQVAVRSLDVNPIRLIVRLLILRLRYSKLLLVMSTYPEYLVPKSMAVNLFILSLIRSKILCVRNPKRWIENLHFTCHKSEKLRIKLSRFLNRFLMNRYIRSSQPIVVESEKQKSHLIEKLANLQKLENKIIVFPGRLSDLKPTRASISELENTETRFIGLLGSLDENRRDSKLLLDALLEIEEEHRPSVMILGSTSTPDAKSIIESYLIAGINLRGSAGQVLSETEFYLRGSKCFALIAPFRKSWGYGGAMGSGSIADAISLERPLLIPTHISFEKSDYEHIYKFDDSQELSNQIRTLLCAPKSVYFDSTHYYSVKKMGKLILEQI